MAGQARLGGPAGVVIWHPRPLIILTSMALPAIGTIAQDVWYQGGFPHRLYRHGRGRNNMAAHAHLIGSTSMVSRQARRSAKTGFMARRAIDVVVERVQKFRRTCRRRGGTTHLWRREGTFMGAGSHLQRVFDNHVPHRYT